MGGVEMSGHGCIIGDRCAIHPATYCVEVGVFSHGLIKISLVFLIILLILPSILQTSDKE